ncbi:hypothetical protein ONZ43_g4843 [Nemania bipapillata]|uniref:Uncharacterized protein n=1 Tax=Nemania bipapillata TaxID=110536 RepID=A0ACC2IHL9_9PEZI|nr:hypothetical protein ONZ43_g4843 [Nemania bipapillata]
MAGSFIILTFGVVVLYFIFLVTYRLFFSPIAGVPGSKLAAATGWYEAYFDVALGGQFVFKIEEWHKKYGPIVRVNPWEVHISDPDFYDVYFSTRSKHSKFKPWQKRFGLPLSTFDAIHHEEHNRRRQAVAPFFTRQRVLDYIPFIQKCVDRMCNRIEQEYRNTSKTLCLDEVFSSLTSDVITYYSFALFYDFLGMPDFKSPFTLGARRLALSVHVSGHIPGFLWLMQSLPRSWVAVINPSMKHVFDFHGELRNQIQRIMNGEHKNNPSQSSVYPTVFSDLMESNLRPEEKTVDLFFHEAGIIVGAGIETTKAALTIASFHVLANPSTKHRLQKELREAMPEPLSAPLTLAQLEKLPYLHGVVQEC